MKRNILIKGIVIVMGVIGVLVLIVAHLRKEAYHSRWEAMINNVQILGEASQTYMMDKGLTQVSYANIVGTTKDAYVHGITPVVDEDYTHMTFTKGQSQIILTSPYFGTITYEF